MNKGGQQRILVADDSPEIRQIVRILLSAEGFEVLEAEDGQQAVEQVDETVDLIILDVVMPVKDGVSACLDIRKATLAPILFLTAKAQDSDKTMGFSAGGDDYLAKPFSYSELISRVKSLLRRYYIYQGKPNAPAVQEALMAGRIRVDPETRTVTVGGAPVSLTDIEYRMLVLLLTHRKKIFSAENLYESIWEEPYFYTANNTVMVHIRNLRKKIEDDPQNPTILKTVWGKGYCIE
jgi:two-component system OmpR family response regulator